MLEKYELATFQLQRNQLYDKQSKIRKTTTQIKYSLSL